MPYLKCVDKKEAKYILEARQEMQQMLEVWECPTPPSRKSDDDRLPIAVCTVGN